MCIILDKSKHYLECAVLDIFTTSLEDKTQILHSGEIQNRTVREFDLNDVINVSQKLIQLCASNMIALPYQTKNSANCFLYDYGLTETFIDEINSKIDMNKIRVKGTSKIAKVWRTKECIDEYDINKVLESFEDLKTYDTKKNKNKSKKKKMKKEKFELTNEVSTNMESLKAEKNFTKFISSEPSEQSPTISETTIQVFRESTGVESPQPENNQPEKVLETEVESVQEYIDSIEQENRCLKVSQQFYNRLEKDLEKLKESKLCKICMDEEACIVFIPCGHLMSCVNCSPGMKNCAICRKPVKSTVRTYFS